MFLMAKPVLAHFYAPILVFTRRAQAGAMSTVWKRTWEILSYFHSSRLTLPGQHELCSKIPQLKYFYMGGSHNFLQAIFLRELKTSGIFYQLYIFMTSRNYSLIFGQCFWDTAELISEYLFIFFNLILLLSATSYIFCIHSSCQGHLITIYSYFYHIRSYTFLHCYLIYTGYQ